MRAFNFFDFDGTICDSGPGIINAVKYSLSRFSIPEQDDSSYRKYVGPPLAHSFRNFAGLSEKDSCLAIKLFREYYADKGKYESTLYEGIDDMLKSLRSMGAYLAVTTSKLDTLACEILDYFGLMDVFDFVSGSTADNSRTTKTDVLYYAISHVDQFACGSAVLIGDRFYDVEGAHAFGIDSVGVLYGYGTREELEAHNADFICNDVKELKDLLISL